MSDDLFLPCKAGKCADRIDKSKTYWYHHLCGGKTKINYFNAHIYCPTCNKSSIIFNWKFNCGEHGF